ESARRRRRRPRPPPTASPATSLADREDALHARLRPVGGQAAVVPEPAAVVEEEQQDLLLLRLQRLAESRLDAAAALCRADRERVRLAADVVQDETGVVTALCMLRAEADAAVRDRDLDVDDRRRRRRLRTR